MSAAAAFSAEVIRSSAKGLAAMATERLLPVLKGNSQYGGNPAATWRAHLVGRVDDLALAVAAVDEHERRSTGSGSGPGAASNPAESASTPWRYLGRFRLAGLN